MQVGRGRVAGNVVGRGRHAGSQGEGLRKSGQGKPVGRVVQAGGVGEACPHGKGGT